MIRERIAIFFILFASIVILVHAVIPHHHNNGYPSFIEFHLHEDGVKHYDTHNHNTSEHDHSSDKDSHDCILKQVVFIPTDILKQKFQFNNFHKDQKENISLLFKSESHSFKIFPNPTFTPPPDFKTIYIFYVNRGVSLRGPPVV